MPLTSTPIGPFAGLYIGLTAQSSALSPINSTRTEGALVNENLPTEFVVSIGNSVQSGNHTATITCTFLGDADEVVRLCRGLNLTEDINNPPAQNLYALFLAGADSSSGSFYFPKIRTQKDVVTAKTKTSPTVTQITFIAESRDVTEQIIARGSYATLATIMGSQFPL